MYSSSPEQLCASNKFTYLYTTLFNPVKHAIDMTLTEQITNILQNDTRAVNWIALFFLYDFEIFLVVSNRLQTLKIKIAQFNCPSYVTDNLKSRFGFFTPLVIQLAFMITLLVNVGNVVVEKETKMKVSLFNYSLFSLRSQNRIINNNKNH